MIKALDLSKLHEQYANETPEQKALRYAENKKRIDDMITSWNKFAEEFPEAARLMKCAA